MDQSENRRISVNFENMTLTMQRTTAIEIRDLLGVLILGATGVTTTCQPGMCGGALLQRLIPTGMHWLKGGSLSSWPAYGLTLYRGGRKREQPIYYPL